MPDKPCTHCGGSGTEPDPLNDAWVALGKEIGQISGVSDGARQRLTDTAARAQVLTEGRITELEAALRDILGRLHMHRVDRKTVHVQAGGVPLQSWDGWNATLAGEPEPETCPEGC